MRKRSKALVLFLLMMVMSICGVFNLFAAVEVKPVVDYQNHKVTYTAVIHADGSSSTDYLVTYNGFSVNICPPQSTVTVVYNFRVDIEGPIEGCFAGTFTDVSGKVLGNIPAMTGKKKGDVVTVTFPVSVVDGVAKFNINHTSGIDPRTYKEKITVAHTPVRKYDSTGHWDECKYCGVVTGSKVAHSSGVCDYMHEGVCEDFRRYGYCRSAHNHTDHRLKCPECDYVIMKIDESNWELYGTSSGHYGRCPYDGTRLGVLSSHSEGGWKGSDNYHWKECTVCGYVTTKNAYHVIDGWKSNSTQHWKECNTCGYITRDKANHIDSNNDGKCDTCECAYCTHSTTKWDSNPSGHRKVCTVCGVETEARVSHTVSGWKSNSTQHWKECTSCGYITTAKVNHTASGWKYDTNQHWKECTSCGYITTAKANHSYTKKYYSENGVSNSYYIMTCSCGKEQTGTKVYEKTTVHYDMNGGTGTISDVQVDRGKGYKVSATMPARTGYTFTGWSTTKNGTVQFQGDDVAYPSGTTYTLYACWEAKKFQLYFSGQTPAPAPIEVTYGQPIGTLPAVVNATGWSEEKSGTKVDSTTVYVWTESITLVPYDEVVTVDVTFVTDDESRVVTIPRGGLVTVPFVPSKTGYTFKWWSTSRSGSAFDFSSTIGVDTTLYAVFEGNPIEITFLGCGVKTYYYPSTLGTMPVAEQQGATFVGWYWDAECTQPASADEIVPMYSTTLYPKFDLIKFTVTLEGHGTIEISQYDLIPELPVPEVDGQTFRGWFLNDGTQIKKGDEYIWNYPITLYPKYDTIQWVITLPNGESRLVYDGDVIGNISTGSVSAGTRVIGFKDQKGNVVDKSTIVRGNMTIIPVLERNRVSLTLMDGDTQYTVRDVDAGLRVTDLPSLSKAGYTFRGWSQGENGSVTTGPFYSDTTLYAVYSADKQTITLNELNQTVEKATGTQIGSLPIPVKDGYEFGGWLWNGSPITAETIVPAGGMNLTPSWNKIEIDNTRFVTIRYWSDGIRINTVDMNPGEILYDPGAPALNDLQKTEGRVFAYWSTRSGGQYTFGKRISADLDLYAVWQ